MNASADITPAKEVEARRASNLWMVYPLVLAMLVGTLYVLTLRVGVGGETDGAKWQFVGDVLGVPHTTGYPLYVLLSHLFSYLPLGTLAWRVNFMSAFFAVAAVVTLQRILRGLLQNEILAFGGALLLAVSPLFWKFAVVAGVYSLNAFFVCLVIYFLFKWSDMVRERGMSPDSAGRGYFYAACFVYALSFGNHVTMITLLPAFVFFALVTDRRTVLNLKTALLALLFVALAASLYSLPFISTNMPSPYLENRVETFGDLWNLITASGFRQYMFMHGVKGPPHALLSFYLRSLIAQFTIFGFLVMAAGLFLLGTKHGVKLFFLLIYLSVNLFMTLNYHVPQVVYQFIPSYVVLAIIMGFSAGLFRVVAPYLRSFGGAVSSALCLAVLLGMAAFTMFSNMPGFKAKQEEARLNDILANDVVDALPPDGVILANDYVDSMILFYKMLGEKRGREKEWRVMHDAGWKTIKPEAGWFDPANVASRYDVETVGRLLKGEEVNWSPLALKDKNAGRHEIYFWSRDKILLDMAGFLSERVDLPGEAGEKNVYGGGRILLYRITRRVDRPPEDIIEIYNEGLTLLRDGKLRDALFRFSLLTFENKGFAEAYFQLGMCFRGMKKYEKAREQWKKVLDLIPDYKPAIEELKKLPQPPGQTTAELRDRSEG